MESTAPVINDDEPPVSRQARLAIFTFLLGNAVSLVGNAMTLVALPWFVLETTGSAGRTGLTGMMAALPALIAGVLGGALVDRFGGRRMSVISDIISGLSIAAIPILYATTEIAFWQLLALVFVGAALDIPGMTARRTLLPELAERARMRPEAMTSAFETMQGLALIIGPAIAGVLIGWFGAVSILWVTAGGFAFSSLMIGLFAPTGKHEATTSPAEAVEGFFAEVRAGLTFLRTDSLLLSLAIGLTLMNFLNTPFWTVVLPVQIERNYGIASRFGFLLTMYGIGNLAGGMLFGVVGHRFRHVRRGLYLTGIVAFTALLWLMLPGVSCPVLAGLVLLTGLLTGPINPLLVTVRFERIPKELRGRVFATFSALSGEAAPLGMLAAGWMLEGVGLYRGIFVLAILSTIFTIGLFLTRPYREMNIDEDGTGVPDVTGPAKEPVTVAAEQAKGTTSRRLARRDPRMDSGSS